MAARAGKCVSCIFSSGETVIATTMKGGSLNSEKGANVAGQTRGNGHHVVP